MGLDINASPGDVLAKLTAMAKEQNGLPPVDKWNPEFCGDIDMVIHRDGSWSYMGTPIGRAAMVRLFSTVLRHDEDGKFYLITPVEKIGITVEDAPFIAVGLHVVGAGEEQTLTFTTNVGDETRAAPERPLRFDINSQTEEVAPYVLVRGRLEAKIARSVYYQLVDLGTTHKIDGTPWFGVWSSGTFFPMAPESAVQSTDNDIDPV